jgi:hypothetical protein
VLDPLVGRVNEWTVGSWWLKIKGPVRDAGAAERFAGEPCIEPGEIDRGGDEDVLQASLSVS